MTNAAGVGTPCMWAPELWLADECDGHKLDMWACGLMIYQLVAGELPFDHIDFEQELDPQRLMFMSETVSDFGRQAGSPAGPPMPTNGSNADWSLELRQLLGGLLQPEPGPRFTAEDAIRQAWCNQECSASIAQAKVAEYAANGLEARNAIDEGLRSLDPNQWADAGERKAPLQSSQHSHTATSPLRRDIVGKTENHDEANGESEDELDAVQAEIAKLKAEMGL